MLSRREGDPASGEVAWLRFLVEGNRLLRGPQTDVAALSLRAREVLGAEVVGIFTRHGGACRAVLETGAETDALRFKQAIDSSEERIDPTALVVDFPLEGGKGSLVLLELSLDVRAVSESFVEDLRHLLEAWFERKGR